MDGEKFLFPKGHKLFIDDKQVLSIISKIESYSEIWWEMKDVATTVETLYELFQEDKIKSQMKKQFQDVEIDEETEEAVKTLSKDYLEKRTDFQKKRDEFQDFISVLGKRTALLFLSSGLVHSLEYLLSGAITTYVKSFNSSTGRSRLKAKDVFKDNVELLDSHEYIIVLRNKHYAHVDIEANRFFLKFQKNNDENGFKIDKNMSHNTVNFSENFKYSKFLKCINVNIIYLEKSISAMTKTLYKKLSSEQKELLKNISEDDAFELSGYKRDVLASRSNNR